MAYWFEQAKAAFIEIYGALTDENRTLFKDFLETFHRQVLLRTIYALDLQQPIRDVLTVFFLSIEHIPYRLTLDTDLTPILTDINKLKRLFPPDACSQETLLALDEVAAVFAAEALRSIPLPVLTSLRNIRNKRTYPSTSRKLYPKLKSPITLHLGKQFTTSFGEQVLAILGECVSADGVDIDQYLKVAGMDQGDGTTPSIATLKQLETQLVNFLSAITTVPLYADENERLFGQQPSEKLSEFALDALLCSKVVDCACGVQVGYNRNTSLAHPLFF
ncbi:hypothetical protein HK102_003834 [Quaeritorhiza haematococci]|nr:hypothetical protein HK102_003834 [Quaeritorhiza haematococci]